MRSALLCVLTSFLVLLTVGCSVRPYLKSNVFSALGLEPQEVNRCIAMLQDESVDYFLCEPENRLYKIKIIPIDNKSAVTQILHEQNSAQNPFSSVIGKDILQVSILINYLFLPKEGIQALKKGRKPYLLVKSVEGEKAFIDAIFILDRYSAVSAKKRDKLRR